MDIAWCYLQIGNLSELPNAQESLKECERNFAKNYGANLERVKKLKGTTTRYVFKCDDNLTPIFGHNNFTFNHKIWYFSKKIY